MLQTNKEQVEEKGEEKSLVLAFPETLMCFWYQEIVLYSYNAILSHIPPPPIKLL